MSWKGLREENQMEICIEKCASVHGFVCMRFGIETVTFIETFTKRPLLPNSGVPDNRDLRFASTGSNFNPPPNFGGLILKILHVFVPAP